MPRSDIEVLGLRELRKELQQAEGRSPMELQQANRQVAELVAIRARNLAPHGKHEGGGKIQPLTAAIKAQATTTRAFVAFGGARAPHGAVVNFGGTIPRRGFKGVTLTEKRKGKIVAGRRHAAERFKKRVAVSVTQVPRQEHIYTAIHQLNATILRTYQRAVGRITRSL